MSTKAVKATEGNEKIDPNISDKDKEQIQGIAGDPLSEEKPRFYRLQNEYALEKNDSYIVLGRDRTGGILSGRGVLGEGKASSIDIIVGRQSCVSDQLDLVEESKWSNPDFRNDAARVYVSQKTDIDKAFDLPAGVSGVSSGKSGVGIKADTVRVVARSSVKIVASNDTVDSSRLQDTRKVGVELISGTPYDPRNNEVNQRLNLNLFRDDMQPIPKGENLKNALSDIVKQLEALSGAFMTFVNMQMEWNNFMAMHTHTENFYGLPGYPSQDMIAPNIELNFEILEKTTKDIATFKMQYLNYFNETFLSTASNKYINSRYHHLN